MQRQPRPAIEPEIVMPFAGDPADKANTLLRNWLTPSQRRCFSERNYFVVKGNVTHNLYRITNNYVFNVEQLDSTTGLAIRKLCFVPDNAPHVGDIMLAQKIMLEHFEEMALRIANKQPVPHVTTFGP